MGFANTGAMNQALLVVAALCLSGCERPDWTDPAKSKGPREPAADQAAPAPPKVRTTQKPAPPRPDWAGNLMGKRFQEAFPRRGVCVGNVDGAGMLHLGSAPGAQIFGWAWDVKRQARVARVLLVDVDDKIAGAGDGGLPRPDALTEPGVTASDTGWRAVTDQVTGAFDAYGIVEDGRGLCRLGNVKL